MSWHADAWAHLNPGSVYNGLRTLAREGLLEEVGTEARGGRPARTSYRLTGEGESEFFVLLRRALWDVRQFEPSDLMAGWGFSYALEREEVIAALEHRGAADRRLGPGHPLRDRGPSPHPRHPGDGGRALSPGAGATGWRGELGPAARRDPARWGVLVRRGAQPSLGIRARERRPLRQRRCVGGTRMSRRAEADAGRGHPGLRRGHDRWLDRQRRAALDRAGSRRGPVRPAVDLQRLPADPRVVDPDRRLARRHLRRAPHLLDRGGRVRCVLDHVRARADDRRAPGRTGAPGHGRSAAHSELARRDRRCVLAARAQRSDRRVDGMGSDRLDRRAIWGAA